MAGWRCFMQVSNSEAGQFTLPSDRLGIDSSDPETARSVAMPPDEVDFVSLGCRTFLCTKWRA
jgi:hypothetical protein